MKVTIFNWIEVVFNLPGTLNHTLSCPIVYIIRCGGKMATTVIWYCDDGKGVGPTKLLY